jgi:hypothetical protein
LSSGTFSQSSGGAVVDDAPDFEVEQFPALS